MNDNYVILKTFLGEESKPQDIKEEDNYWKLIDEKGKIIEEDIRENKVLVLFENNLDDFNIINHNPQKNTLWILKSDLVNETRDY